MSTPIPCADVELEAAYVRSCYGPTTSRKYTHLADGAARLAPEDCAWDDHGRILAAYYALVDGKVRIEPQRMRAELTAAAFERWQLLTAEQGPEDVGIVWAADRLRELARRRRKRQALARAIASLDAGHDEAADEHVLTVTSEATESRGGEYLSAGEAVEAKLAEVERARTQATVARTGFLRVDHAVGTLRAKTLTVVGGTTGSGKSSLMLAMAMHQARRGMRVGIISAEDAETVWGERVLAHTSGLNPAALAGETAHLTAKIAKGVDEASRLGLHFAFELGRPVGDVLRAARHLVRKHGCQVLYIDYLQAIQDTSSRERRVSVAGMAARIKAQCQELGVTCVLGSQVSRPSKDRPFGEVYASDLKESGDIENMSEVVMLLWRTGDKTDSPTLGKVAKVKWSPERPRFQVQRDGSGAVVGLSEPAEPEQPEKGRGRGYA